VPLAPRPLVPTSLEHLALRPSRRSRFSRWQATTPTAWCREWRRSPRRTPTSSTSPCATRRCRRPALVPLVRRPMHATPLGVALLLLPWHCHADVARYSPVYRAWRSECRVVLRSEPRVPARQGPRATDRLGGHQRRSQGAALHAPGTHRASATHQCHLLASDGGALDRRAGCGARYTHAHAHSHAHFSALEHRASRWRTVLTTAVRAPCRGASAADATARGPVRVARHPHRDVQAGVPLPDGHRVLGRRMCCSYNLSALHRLALTTPTHAWMHGAVS